METVPEVTRDGEVLYRTEIRRDGRTIDATALTPSRVTATRDGCALLAQHRNDLPDAKPFHDQALQLFAHVA